MNRRERVVYTVPVPVALRGVGVGAVGLGGCVVVASVLLAVQPARPVSMVVGVLLALAAALAMVVFASGALRLAGRGPRLVLDQDGFTNTTGPGAGVRRAAWTDVQRVRTSGRVVAVDLAGGRQSLIRTASLDVDPRALARQLRDRRGRRFDNRPAAPRSE